VINSLRGRDILYYAIAPLLFVAALVQSTMLTRVEIGSVKPDLVLILVIIATLIYGGRRGIAFAFIGGIALDLFSGGPMGASSLALILAAVAVSPGNSTFSRFNVLVPISACIVGTVVYGLAYIGVLVALDVVVRLPFFDALTLSSDTELRVPFMAIVENTLLPSVAYNAAIMLLLTPILNRIPEAHDVGS
jgi:rod shape-determining protein MreD